MNHTTSIKRPNRTTSVFTEEGSAFDALCGADAGRAFALPGPKVIRKQVIVIGGGQAGLSVGYHLAKRGVDFLILDGSPRIGDAWRNRWDGLRLFSPAMYDGLDGMPFPAPKHEFPTKDQMADYLEAYASRFALPVISSMQVSSLTHDGERYVVLAGDRRFEADQVIVAMSNYQVARIPDFARDLDPAIRQLHAADYRNPAQLAPGGVLIAGAGNSGAEIAKELSPAHRIWMAGPSTGETPGRHDDFINTHIVVHILLRLVFPHILSVYTPIGRKVRPQLMKRGTPLIRVKARDLAAVGVERTPRVTGVKDGRPLLEDGRVLDVANVVWCTGFAPGFSWIKTPVLLANGEPDHEHGVIACQSGLYFVGLHFLTSMSSSMVHGVGRDARRIAALVAARTATR
jgi:putative flavoprotein involved in K+ transport